MKKYSIVLGIALVAFTSFFFSSCVKKDYDEPVTANLDPNLTATKTIAQLQALAGAVPTLISADEIISGVVIADDASGNFYKEMIIQDETAGLSVQLDMSNYNTSYPIGRRMFVKCKGLYIQKDVDGNYSIGTSDAGAIGRIPQTLVPQYLVPGKWGQPVTPRTVTLFSLASAPSNTLVKISDVEFSPADTAQPYANAATLQSVNRIIQDCCAHTIKLYSSGYSNFANTLTPTGHGSIVAVYKLYGGAGELEVRDASDASMTGARCTGSGTLNVGTGSLMNIVDIRNAYTGCDAVFAAGTKIRGTVISDLSTTNINSFNLVMQDGTAGVLIRLTVPNTFPLNDSIEIDLSGLLLTNYQSTMEINNVNVANVTSLGTGSVIPRVATISEVFSNQNAWESTLVKITGVTLSGGTAGTYSGNVTMNDGTGTLTLYTRSGATFSPFSYPTTTVSVTSYITHYFTTIENAMRSTADVQ